MDITSGECTSSEWLPSSLGCKLQGPSHHNGVVKPCELYNSPDRHKLLGLVLTCDPGDQVDGRDEAWLVLSPIESSVGVGLGSIGPSLYQLLLELVLQLGICNVFCIGFSGYFESRILRHLLVSTSAFFCLQPTENGVRRKINGNLRNLMYFTPVSHHPPIQAFIWSSLCKTCQECWPVEAERATHWCSSSSHLQVHKSISLRMMLVSTSCPSNRVTCFRA